MGQIKTPVPAKLFVAVMVSAAELFKAAEGRLTELYGPMDFSSPVFSFDDYSRYYEPEMGASLLKRFVSFAQPIAQEAIAAIKLQTNALEMELGQAGPDGLRRRVNLDPGYLTASKLALATTKDYAHRIYLGQGIYAETTLYYRRGQGWQPYPWTYADYRSALAGEFFALVRESILVHRQVSFSG